MVLPHPGHCIIASAAECPAETRETYNVITLSYDKKKNYSLTDIIRDKERYSLWGEREGGREGATFSTTFTYFMGE